MQEKGVKIMPKVGDKSFPYTPKGMAQAETEAEITGEEVIPTYDAGGRTERIQGYGDEKSGTPSNLIANGAMTDEEVVKYINPQATSAKGGKVPEYKKGGKVDKKKTYEEKGETFDFGISMKAEGLKGKVTSRRDLMEGYKEKEVRERSKKGKKGKWSKALKKAIEDSGILTKAEREAIEGYKEKKKKAGTPSPVKKSAVFESYIKDKEKKEKKKKKSK